MSIAVRSFVPPFARFFAAVLVLTGTCLVQAQSGARQPSQSGSATRPSTGSATRPSTGSATKPSGSATRDGMMAKPGLDGYCPVCIIEKKEWVKGDANITASYDGKTYLFPGEDIKQMFLANPAKYVPALGGDCTVCYANMNKRAPGSVQHATIYKNRLFLFPSADIKAKFRDDLQKYDAVDLAMNGMCSVCKVEMNQEVPGDTRFTVMHKGMRYLFPGEKQRDMFLANPDKYSNAGPIKLMEHRVQPTNKQIAKLISATGASGCAACDHGVKPLGSPQELGLAINNGIDILVVEDAHRLYPEIYKSRFDGIQLAVSGTVIQQKGNIKWVQPTELRRAL